MKLDCPEGSILSSHISCSDGKCETDAWPECSTRKTREELENESTESIRWMYSGDCYAAHIDYLDKDVDCHDDDIVMGDGDANIGHKSALLEESTAHGAFRKEHIFPCFDCKIFEWSAWTTSSPGRLTRVRGNNTIVDGSYEEDERDEAENVRLVRGNGNNTGSVYVTNSEGYHGPVCDNKWNHKAATVVCKELGFTGGIAKRNSYFGKEADFAMDEVECSGSETSILQCSHKIDFGDYTFYNVAGVDCY